MKLTHFQLTHVGLVREENQDSIFTEPANGLFLVADGMGGEKAGAEASAQVAQTVQRISSEYFMTGRAVNPRAVGEMVTRALQEANKDVFQISVREPAKAGLGSTGSLLVLYRGLYFISQVGDSRVYLLRDGAVRQLTRDHSIVWELYENGIINRSQLETHPERHLLTQCIGGAKPIQVDLFSDKVQPGDLYLVCSDGLTGYAGESKVIQILLQPGLSLEERGKQLFDAAMAGGGGDNVSVILAQVNDLDKNDTWIPEITNNQPKRESYADALAANSHAPGRAGHHPPHGRRRQSDLYLAGGVLGFGLLAVLTALLLKPGRVTTNVELVGLKSPDALQVTVIDELGNPWRPENIRVEGSMIHVSAPARKKLVLQYDAPGILPGSLELNFSGESELPTYISVLDAAQLILSISDTSQIAKIQITSADPNSVIYAYDRATSAGAEPRLEHDLDPDQPHTVAVTNLGGQSSETKVRIPAGQSESLAVRFD